MFSEVIKSLSEEQREWVNETGFGFVLMFTFADYPVDICMFIINSLQQSLSFLDMNGDLIKFGKEDVHRVLGLPKGTNDILFSEDQNLLSLWESQFSNENLCDDGINSL